MTNMKSFQIGNITGVHPQPAKFKSALEGAAQLAEVLSKNGGLFAQDATLAPIAKAAILAGQRCAGYAAVIADDNNPVQILESIYNDFQAITRFVDQLISTRVFGVYAATAVTAVIKSVFGQMAMALEEIQPALPVGQFNAGMSINPMTPATIGQVVIVTARQVPVHSLNALIQSAVIAGASQDVLGFSRQQKGRVVEITLDEKLRVAIAGSELNSEFGSDLQVVRMLRDSITSLEGQWGQVPGCELFAANQHEVTLAFPDRQITVKFTSPKEISASFGDAEAFFTNVMGQLNKYLAQHVKGSAQFSPSTPITSTWGMPQFVKTGARTSTTAPLATV